MYKKASYAKFHQSIFVPELGHLGDTLPSQTKTLTNFSLYVNITTGNLIVSGKSTGGYKQVLVPAANIACVGLVEPIEFTEV